MSRGARVGREKATVRTMVTMYCEANHGSKDRLCPQCGDLLRYSEERVDRCSFVKSKPTCVKCPVHCYSPSMRAQMRTVMRYSGPRMLRRHPVLALRHMVDGLRRPRK